MPTSEIFPPGSKVVAYLRDSGGDAQDLSVLQQRQALQKWADEQQIQITDFYIDEARPGTSVARREAFLRMIAHFRKPTASEVGVILWSYSRFSRDINDAAYYKAELRMRGYKVVSITDNVPEGIDGVIFESLIAWKDAKFIEDLSTNARRGVHQLVTDYGALGGTPPRGLKREEQIIGKRRDGSIHRIARWVPDPNLWEICRIAWHMRSEGKTYRQINDATHLFGSINSYSTFFRNSIYKGDLIYGGQIIKGYVEPLVDSATWEKVQKMFSPEKNPINGGRDHPRRLGSSYLLSGLVYCARCGAPMNGAAAQFDDAKNYQYYKCSRAGRRHDCDAVQIPRETLEEIVIDKVCNYVLDPVQVKARQEMLVAEKEKISAERNAIKNQLNAKIAKINREIRNIKDVIKERGRSSAPLIDELDELDAAKKEIQKQLFDLQNRTIYPEDIHPDEAAENAVSLRDEILSSDPATVKHMLRGFILNIYAERDGKRVAGIVNFTSPPDKNNLLPPDNSNPGPDDKFIRKVIPPVGAQSLLETA